MNEAESRNEILRYVALCKKLGKQTAEVPVTGEDVSQFEQEAGISLGDPMRTLLYAATSQTWFIGPGENWFQFCGFAEMRKRWFDWQAVPRFGAHAGQEVTIPGTSRRGVSLLAIDATGNELVVIIENGKLRRLYSIDIPQNFPEFNRVGQVLSWNHEIDEYSLAAKTLAELCRRSAERVNASNDKEDGT